MIIYSIVVCGMMVSWDFGVNFVEYLDVFGSEYGNWLYTTVA
jgi:hypothetical protein